MSDTNYTRISQGRRAALDRAGNKRFDGAGMNTRHNSFHGTDTPLFRSKDAIEARERQAYVDGLNDAVEWALAIIDISVLSGGVAFPDPTKPRLAWVDGKHLGSGPTRSRNEDAARARQAAEAAIQRKL
jgi:hypothetical protein